jgi:putative membrane protein
VAGTFFTEDAQARIALAVKAVESKSSAEIVVSVRGRSADYRELDLGFGLALAILTLVVLIYHPAELDEDLMPVETVAAFVLGSALVAKVGGLKRLLLSRKRRDRETLTAARAHFVEAGISRTRDRSGILFFVSELERTVAVVPDLGIDVSKLGDRWTSRIAKLEAAAASLDVPAFVSALGELGPVLGEAYPRREDDVNELPDAPGMAAR